jgi:hypothetical protein
MRPERTKAAVRSLLALVLPLVVLAGEVYADPPRDWGGGGEGYELSVDDTVKHGGKASGSVKSLDNSSGFGTLTQGFRADQYRGKHIRMTAFVKSENVEGWSGLWMRIDGKEKTSLDFDNMNNRPIKGTNDWQKYEVILDVPDDAEEIYFGCLLAGKGHVWVDDITFEAVGNDVATTGIEITPMQREGSLVKNLRKEPRNLDFEQ